jgi:hypothetical protein
MVQAVSPVVSVVSSGDENARKDYIHPRATLVGALGKWSRVPEPLVFVTELVAVALCRPPREMRRPRPPPPRGGCRSLVWPRLTQAASGAAAARWPAFSCAPPGGCGGLPGGCGGLPGACGGLPGPCSGHGWRIERGPARPRGIAGSLARASGEIARGQRREPGARGPRPTTRMLPESSAVGSSRPWSQPSARSRSKSPAEWQKLHRLCSVKRRRPRTASASSPAWCHPCA